MTRHHTFIHVSALVRGPVGPESFSEDEWAPPAATVAERELVARLGGYRVHPFGGITLGDAQTREDLAFLDDVTLLAFRSEAARLEVAQSLFGRSVTTSVPGADWDQRHTPTVLADLVRGTGARLEEVGEPIENATIVHGLAPQWKGGLQRAFASGGAPDIFVKTASLVTGFVNAKELPEPLDDARRTLIIDLDALLDDQGSFTRRDVDRLHALAHDIGAYRTIVRTSHWFEMPPARFITEMLVPGQYAEVIKEGDGRAFADAVAATSHYRRSLADDVVTLRGWDDEFWADFDSRAWMLGAPILEVELESGQ